MKITMQFSFDSIKEFSQWASCLAGGAPVAVAVEPSGDVVGAATLEELAPAVQTAAPPTPRKRGRPAKGNTASGEDSAAPAPQAEPTPEPAAPAPSPAPVNDQPATPENAGTEPALTAAAPTEADAKSALERMFQARGFQGAQQVLSHLGANRLRDLPADQYPALIAEIDRLVGA